MVDLSLKWSLAPVLQRIALRALCVTLPIASVSVRVFYIVTTYKLNTSELEDPKTGELSFNAETIAAFALSLLENSRAKAQGTRRTQWEDKTSRLPPRISAPKR